MAIPAKWKLTLALMALGVLAAGSMAPRSTAANDRPVVSAREATIGGQSVGELVVDNQVVIRVRASAGGYTPLERAQKAAQRLDKAIGQGATYQDITAGKVGNEWAVLAKGETIITADAAHARMNGVTREKLAHQWRTNIVNALLGRPVSAEPAPVKPGEMDWSEGDKKIVPILDVSNNGVRIGAAQVVGPKEQVAQVKAVGQLGLNVGHSLRAKVYIPMSSLNVTKLDRVQGVSVWAVGALKILDL